MAAESTAPPAAPKKKRNLVPVFIIVGIVVLLIIAAGVYKLTKSDSSSSKGVPAGQTAKGLYKAWQAGNRAGAAKDASPTAVTAIFAVPASNASGLTFGGCSATGSGPYPKECVWSRPGGELTMTLQKNGDSATVTKVTYGAAGTTPTSTG